MQIQLVKQGVVRESYEGEVAVAGETRWPGGMLYYMASYDDPRVLDEATDLFIAWGLLDEEQRAQIRDIVGSAREKLAQ